MRIVFALRVRQKLDEKQTYAGSICDIGCLHQLTEIFEQILGARLALTDVLEVTDVIVTVFVTRKETRNILHLSIVQIEDHMSQCDLMILLQICQQQSCVSDFSLPPPRVPISKYLLLFTLLICLLNRRYIEYFSNSFHCF